MTSRPTVFLLDLWKTLGYSIDRDPILDVQEALGHNLDPRGQAVHDPEFMRVCLTTSIDDRRRFLEHVAATFGRQATVAAHEAFVRLLEQESGGFDLYADALPALDALRAQGTRLGLISNLWPFPVRRIFVERGLAQYFEHMVFSFELGFAKPEEETFREAAHLFRVNPEDCVMVGDSPLNDVDGALAVGMQAVLIDRSGRAKLNKPGASVIKSLTELADPHYFSGKAA